MTLRTALHLIVRQSIHDNGQSLSPKRLTPLVIDPLPHAHRMGLIAVAVTSLLSVITTVGLFAFITYRLIYWRKYHSNYIGYNQYVILIYNLLIADFQEALGFFLSIQWAIQNSLTPASPVCPLQGWLLQIGDPASGIFVMAIGIHTFLIVVMGKKMSHRVFVSFVVGLWVFCLLLVLVPTSMYGKHTFAPSGAWCWIDERFEASRLWGHYFWIFVAEFGSIAIYSILFFYLRRRVSSSPLMGRGQKEHLRRLRRVTGYMVLYPLAYIILSLPLAAGRMAMARGERLSIVYLCTAGAVISSSGFVDVIMYALTRRALLLDSQPSNIDRAYGSGRYQLNNGHMATVTADPRSSRGLNYLSYHHHRRRESERTQCRAPADDVQTAESNLEMLGFGKVYQKTTIEITSEPADIEEGSTPGRSTPSGPSCDLMNPVDPIQTPGRAWIGPKGGC